MSKATKRKYVTQEVRDEYVLPQDDQCIVKVLASRGNNLHEVVTDVGDTYLVSMPTKFRKNVWIKRDDFVIVEPIAEGGRVRGEIARILLRQQVQHIKDSGLWPAGFTVETPPSTIDAAMLPPSDSDDEGAGNPNRPPAVFDVTDSSSEEEEER